MSASVRESAYRIGSLALFLAIGSILAALAFEHVGGYLPCPLCLQQRWAYYAGIPALFAALVLLSANQRRWAALMFFLVSLAFLANSGLGVFHAGIEWGYWPGPATCDTPAAALPAGGGVLSQLGNVGLVSCSQAPWRMFGLSFAGWNMIISVIVALLSLNAAFATTAPRT